MDINVSHGDYYCNAKTKKLARISIVNASLILALFFLVIFSKKIRAEGTPSLSPTITDIVMLNLLGDEFANYGSTGTPKSMCFQVKDPSETVYLGLSQIANANATFVNFNYNFRIVDAAGNVVHGPFQVTPANANGNDYNDIVTGPDLGTGMGYDISNMNYVFMPTAEGEYCIEFENDNGTGAFNFGQMGIPFWDVTIVNGSNNVVPGRLYSECWGFRTPCSAESNCDTGPWDKPFVGTIYTLTTDGFVHEIDFNNSGFQGLSFFLAFNDSGPGLTGEPTIDRKSIDGSTVGNASATNPLYPVFVNDPDPACYEEGTIGTVIGPEIIIEDCDLTTVCLEFTVSEPGLVEVLIDLDGQDGIFTPNTLDTVIALRILEGEPLTQCIPYDLTTGDGSTLMNGDSIWFNVSYYQGEIHFMQYDVESICLGYTPATIHPANNITLPTLYYDDSCLDDNDNDPNIDSDQNPMTGPMPPLTELNGCPAPCHQWKIGTSNGVSGTGYGEVNTINTWWFGNASVGSSAAIISATGTPTFDCPADALVNCGMPTDTLNTGSVTNVMSPCSATTFTVTFEDDGLFDGCGGTGSITRRFFVEDADGNIDSCDQIITVEDLEAPMISCPPDMDLACGDPLPTYEDIAAFTGAGGMVSDNCMVADFGITDTMLVQGMGCMPETYTLTYMAEDSCGNIATCQQTINYTITTTSSFANCPADVIISCGDPTDTMSLGSPTVDGVLCSSASITVMDEIMDGICADEMTIMRLFILDDGCFEPDTCAQMITINDPTPPTFDMPIPADITISCINDLPVPEIINLTDNCGSTFMVMPEDNITDSVCVNELVIERVWMMEDPCGNIAADTQFIFIIDDIPPVIEGIIPSDITVDCADMIPAAEPIDFSDNCLGVVTITPTDEISDSICANIFNLTRIWSFDDGCGNITADSQVIAVMDLMPVDLVCPADITLDCSLVADTLLSGAPMITSSCGTFTIIMEDDSTGFDMSCMDNIIGSIVRTFTVTDDCDNVSNCTQNIVFIDTIAPEIICQDIIIDFAGESTVIVDPADIIVSIMDDCSDFEVFATPESFDCSDVILDSMAVVTITAIDSCGNSATCEANVTFVGFPMLEIFCPNDTTIFLGPGGCDAPVPYVVTALNPCGVDAIITQIDTSNLTAGDDFPIGVTEQIYMATNEYGDTVSCSFTITVIEFDDPNKTLVCNANLNVSVDENCMVFIDASMILEGNNYGCYDDYIIEIFTIPGIPVDNPIIFDTEYSITNNNYMVCITDPDTGNQCCGEINIEDKLTPAIECVCPPGAWMTDPACQRSCLDIERIISGQIGRPIVSDNCGSVTPVYGGYEISDSDNCGELFITQTWSVSVEGYEGGNLPDITCTNEFFITPADIDLVIFPDALSINCEDANVTGLLDPINTGYPILGNLELGGEEINQYCNLIATYEDVEINTCAADCQGPKKVIRTWTAIDWCVGEIVKSVQLISIVDHEAPTLSAQDVTVSTDPWKCSTDIWLENISIHDNCSTDLDWYIKSTNSGATLVDEDGKSNSIKPKQHALDVPKGNWTFVIASADCCGNEGTTIITVSVEDKTPPVAISLENVILSLTTSGSTNVGEGKLFSSSINLGSHDNCSDVHVEIRRDDNPCGELGVSSLTYSNKIPRLCDPWYDINDHDYGDFVTFCCNDLTEVDDNGTEYGLVKVYMRVWDDANMDGSYGSYTFYDNPGNQHDYCDIEDNFNEVWSWVRVENKTDVSLTCPPDITLPCDWDHTDLSVTGKATAYSTCGDTEAKYTDWKDVHCGEGVIYREWSISGYDYTCTQRIFVTSVNVPPLEERIVCPVDPITQSNKVIVDCGNYEIPELWVTQAACSLTGISSEIDTFWFEPGACYKAIKTWTILDWCTNETYNCSFTVTLIDSEGPSIMCTDTLVALDDYWDQDNDGNYCEFENDINIVNSALDSGDCGSEWIKWIVKADYWSDGTTDVEWSSFVPHNDANYLAPSLTGDLISVRLRKNDISAEWAEHTIRWKAFDGCGNVSNCTQIITVGDTKAPTPYCIGISTAFMQGETDLVEIWASDFNLGSFDNCSAKEELIFTFNEVYPVLSKLDEVHYFAADGGEVSASQYENGWPIQKWNPDTKSSATKFIGTEWCGENDIRVSVWDKKGNTDFCWTTLIIHGVVCEGIVVPRADIAGLIETYDGRPLKGAEVYNESDQPNYPWMIESTSDGVFAFNDNIMFTPYQVRPEKNDDYLNGVSTLDLIFIQKHILGLQAFTNPYKIIAADINNDKTVTAVDLVELRKLILGIYDVFPNNGSWKFIDKKESMGMENIWPFKEHVNVASLSEDMMAENFTAVKIGDINNNANTQSLTNEIAKNRTSSLELLSQDLGNGRVAIIAGTNFSNIYGYQFTMQIDGDLIDMQAGSIDINADNFGMLENGILTTSYSTVNPIDLQAGDILFTLNIKGGKRISLADDVTPAEAYKSLSNDHDDSSIEVLDILMKDSSSSPGYSLEQNKPNPFGSQTKIKFMLGEAGPTTLTVYDVTGKILYLNNGIYKKGANQLIIKKQELGASGVLYYRLESGSYTSTKKMIVID